MNEVYVPFICGMHKLKNSSRRLVLNAETPCLGELSVLDWIQQCPINYCGHGTHTCDKTVPLSSLDKRSLRNSQLYFGLINDTTCIDKYTQMTSISTPNLNSQCRTNIKYTVGKMNAGRGGDDY